MLAVLKAAWRAWKRVVHAINALITAVLMTAVYVVALPPVALWFRVAADRSYERRLDGPDTRTAWRPLSGERQDLRRAQRPW